MKNILNKSLVLFISFALMSVISCSGGSNAEPTGQVAVSIPSQIHVGALIIAPRVIKIKVTGNDMNPILSSFDPADHPENAAGVITIPLSIPAGSGRHFIVEVEGPDEGRGFRGEALADIPEAGTTVDVTTFFLNFITDPQGDHFVDAAQDIEQADFSGTLNRLGQKIYSITVVFSQIINSEISRVRIAFDTDNDSLTGNTEIIDKLLVGLHDAYNFGADGYLEVVPNRDNNDATADLNFYDSAQNAYRFQNIASAASATWDNTGDFSILTITFNPAAAQEILTNDGAYVVMAGQDNAAGNTIDAVDTAPEANAALYDLDTLFNQGPLD